MVAALILTVTRACNLRCSYCPTAKDGWPSLSVTDARQAVRLFAERYDGGDVKLFGGEPLLVPEVARAAIDEAGKHARIQRIYLSTNGLGLDRDWLSYIATQSKTVLTLSMDGAPSDHRRYRRSLTGAGDSYDHVVALLPELVRMQRVVVTQTIPPATADRASGNFRHLLDLGFTRFNFLPGYYLPWNAEQLASLRDEFAEIARMIRQRWESRRPTYVRNLFTWAPTPFFNTGIVVDSDRSIHPSNVGLAGALDHLREHTRVGTLDNPPSIEELRERADRVTDMLEGALPPDVWQSTLRVDRELSGFCRDLYPAYLAYRRRRGMAA